MNSDDIFLCKQCGLPIRNRAAAKAAQSPSFTCETCDVCSGIAQDQIDQLRSMLLDLLCQVVNRLFVQRRRTTPPDRFKAAVREKLEKQSNPAELKIAAVVQAIANSAPDEQMFQQIALSESLLAGFFYFSEGHAGYRRRLANSPTLLRHWVALGTKMETLARAHRKPQLVLHELGRDRYDLNLARLSKLIGDNPTPIIRDPQHYLNRPHHEHGTRAGHLADHLSELKEQTKKRDMRPAITQDWISVLRFAGNACLITEWDEVIEFRSSVNLRLCKYLIKDEILIFVDDLWFLKAPVAMPLPELVTIYPKKIAAERLMAGFREHRYVPNCVDLVELTQLSVQIEAELGLA
jgi:hypothetical protein